MERLKLLVVDDEELILSFFGAFLKYRGDDVVLARNGIEALARLEERDFDILITDLRMPGISGIELVSRASKVRPNVVPILLTGRATKDDMVEAIKANVFDYIEKPVSDLSTLSFVLDRAGEKSRLTRERADLMAQLQEKNAKLEENLKNLNRAHEKLVHQDVILKADLGRAQRMQQGLLPRNLPTLGSMDFFGFYQPCQQLGGDFFDQIPLGNDKIALYIADVAGHGVRSAMVTVILHQLIQTQRLLHPDSGCLAEPVQALAFLNQGLIAEPFDEPVHVTMGYAVINLKTGHFSYASAGHPSPLLIRRGSGSESVEGKGPGLGIEANPTFEQTQYDLREGDFIVMYSDGLTECRSDDKTELTLEGLKDWALEMPPMSAFEVGNQIEKRLCVFRNGAPPDDDITYVVIRRAQENLAKGNGNQESVRIRAPSPEPEQPSSSGAQLTAGWAEKGCVIRLSGRATWERAPLLLTLLKEAKSSKELPVFLDMSRCLSVDSTILGILYQFYDRITVFCPTGKVTQQLAELGILQRVHITDRPVPQARMTIPPLGETSGEEQLKIILSAHESLMGSSEENRERFSATVELMKNELDGKQAT